MRIDEVESITQEFDNEDITSDFSNTFYLESLDNVLHNEVLLDELYSKERGHRVEVIGIQLDEMWTFVREKSNKKWLWLALNPVNRQIIAFHVGSRSAVDAKLFYEKIPDVFKSNGTNTSVGFFTDYLQAYRSAFENEIHFGVGKDSGLTAYIERFNCTVRQRVSRLVRKSLSFSKSLENHIGAIKYFICHYNLNLKTLQI